VARRLTLVFGETGMVVTGKVPVVAPAATVMVVGTVAAKFEEAIFTTVPPAGAAAVRVTVPVAPCPPKTLVGATLTPARLWATAKMGRSKRDRGTTLRRMRWQDNFIGRPDSML